MRYADVDLDIEMNDMWGRNSAFNPEFDAVLYALSCNSSKHIHLTYVLPRQSAFLPGRFVVMTGRFPETISTKQQAEEYSTKFWDNHFDSKKLAKDLAGVLEA